MSLSTGRPFNSTPRSYTLSSGGDELPDARAHLGRLQPLLDGVGNFRGDLLRRAGRRGNAHPGVGIDAHK